MTQTAATPIPSIETDDSRPPRRILVVEDNDSSRQLYTKALSKAGYEVHAAATVQMARDLLNLHRFDLLVCDIRLDNGELGIDLLREQAAILGKNGTQIIMSSCEIQYRATCEEMGIEFFMEKPVAIGFLVTLVNRLMA